MSASLVGSEMCIRDSAESADETGRWARRRRFSGGRGSEPPPPGKPCATQPVSYTHLTLPTICSV
eukprot:3954831-Alexandrium_andersonii.AAC.1